jgi:hypothetical protein
MLTGGNVKEKYIGIPHFFGIFQKWTKWGIKHKNLPCSRSGWENSIVFKVFLSPSSHFQ